ncbi:tRNA (adenosine(37)-N6)-threonylcarbamoyltransferase complex transferase subunit TsaD [Pedobacter sp. JCM 36344]|uniref:tRNA (adenosine(37)-N6)-threonylcarbamoyltransferase complex transferase subunit TsaD n=1 Tax=Pedobacter sp. JCM 36344 TaxID=3374280 RepID=UPI003978B626
MSIILAIESSCDETSVAISNNGKITANVIANQTIHQNYGGVIPELASRVHQQNIVPVIQQALLDAKVNKKEVNAVAFTRGPGLLGSLLVGVSFAKAFALALNLPLIAVNHMHAHILAHFIDDPKPTFPFLCLTVSGGHTQIVLVKSYSVMEIVGETLDDAAGEAFDKTAKILSLPYPGGPMVDQHAKLGNPLAYKFAIPQIKDYNYSFSGFKTSVLYFIRAKEKQNSNFIAENLDDICASVQHSIVNILLAKLNKAAKELGISEIAIAGGVSANSGLRAGLQKMAIQEDWRIYIPAFEYCTDNAAMIAMAAHYKYIDQDFVQQDVAPLSRMEF